MAEQQTISTEFPFESHYVEVHGSKLHYVEQGSGDPILYLHGNPTSSYLWRNILPYTAPLGRSIAVDLIGMGKSDKPDIEYRFVDHVKYVEGFIEQMGLRNLTFVIHDWGSALGFHYAMRHEKNVKALVFMEAILGPIAGWEEFPEKMQSIFQAFRTPDVGWDLIVNKHIFVEKVLPASVVRGLREEEMNHYRAPFLNPDSRKPVWRWPNEIPIAGQPADVTAIAREYNKRLQESKLPKLLFHVTPGAIIPKKKVEWSNRHLPNLQTVDLGQGIHFVQEDHPHQIGRELAKWYQAL